MTRRRFSWRLPRVRLSVRTALVLVFIVGCWLGWVEHRAQVQRDAVAAIRNAGGRVYYDWDFKYKPNQDFDFAGNPRGRPRGPRWLIKLLGPDHFGSARIVSLGTVGDLDLVMPHVGRLGQLEVLLIGSHDQLTEAGAHYFAGLTRLRYLRLNCHTKVAGSVLKEVAELRRLQRLELHNLELNDTDLAPLKDLGDLEFVCLRCPSLTDAGLAHLTGLANLRRLHLGPCRITDEGLKPVAHLTNLRILVIESPDFFDVFGMNPQSARTHLQTMVNGYGVTERGVAWLRKTRPLLRVAF